MFNFNAVTMGRKYSIYAAVAQMEQNRFSWINIKMLQIFHTVGSFSRFFFFEGAGLKTKDGHKSPELSRTIQSVMLESLTVCAHKSEKCQKRRMDLQAAHSAHKNSQV